MPKDQKSITFPSATKLDLGINETEDRLVMMAHTQAHGLRGLLLTRRMLAILMDHYGKLIKQTSPASKAFHGHQDEILQMEHIGALSTSAPQSIPNAEQQQLVSVTPSLETIHLVTEVTMQMNDNHLIIGFSGQQRHAPGIDQTPVAPVTAINLDRTNAHKFLAMLNDKAKEAGWGLDGRYPWLNSVDLTVPEQRPVN
jgi:hypothetical protein